jgi:hypothetical protein
MWNNQAEVTYYDNTISCCFVKNCRYTNYLVHVKYMVGIDVCSLLCFQCLDKFLTQLFRNLK